MNHLAWFVRSVRSGDTHLASMRGHDSIRPVCAPEIEFRPMNRRGLIVCFYDEQRCPLCLPYASGRLPGSKRLAVVR
ncbi:hypothetical protein BKA25_002871 [Actinoalloteichus hymeniacidonis]|uniref:Uncharacterized protein n=1 Tax=Actinoalloteichus hymeniacidonis TaxID=340345 RepID=A0AAC9MYF3_9PSEU|nr:hypothetical protein TL08_12950 [Actinoalloteichus hymeniacidonis]MBB5908555.1 hypothetical protein [Actinoalloteichus hymeniacidonis]